MKLGKKKKIVEPELTEKIQEEKIDYLKEIDSLQDELLVERELQNDFQEFLLEKKKMLPYSKAERDRLETVIKFKILKIFEKKKLELESGDPEKGWFKYRDYFNIPELANNFNIYDINGDRNMGKSTSSTEEIDLAVKDNGRFLLMRNIDDEVEAQVGSDLDPEKGWLAKRKWIHGSGKAKAPNIFRTWMEFNPKTKQQEMQKELVGWYRPLNTSAKTKSINFPNTKIIVYEEFNEVVIPHKFLKFVKFASTAIRHEPDVKILMQANYVDQSDPMLQALGLGGKKLTKKDFVIFNWELGAVIINVPSGIYKTTSDKSKDTAYRASLGDYEVWKSQYGGGFSNEEPINIINEKDFVSVTPVFNIYHKNVASKSNKTYGAYKMTLYDVYDTEGVRHNVITKTVGENDKPIFIFDYLNKIMYPDAQMLEIDSLEYLINEWNNNNLKTTSFEVHGIVVALFAAASKALASDEEYFKEIEEI